MDQGTALELVKQGGSLLLIDVPQYTLFGIDTQMFSTGPNFSGIKMIPPGVHFIYYSSSNREGSDFSPMVGSFIFLGTSQVIVRKWDQTEERLVKLSEEEEERYSDAVRRMEFDKQLGPYTLNRYGDWTRLSNFITKEAVERIEPIGGEITISSESAVVGTFSKTEMEQALAEQFKSSKFSKGGKNSPKRGCYYTSIPRLIKHKGMSPEELTSLNLDKTHVLENLLTNEYGNDEDALLAELQFAFIAFLMGQSLEAFFQWKLLVSLLLGCTEAPLRTRSQLFAKFVKVLYYQLKHGFEKDTGNNSMPPQGGASSLLDESLLSSDNFLRHLCKDFFSTVLESPVVDGDLLSSTRKLKQLLEDSLGWQFQQNNASEDAAVYFDEDDEYAPAVEVLDATDVMHKQS